jgi:hypothetical protein
MEGADAREHVAEATAIGIEQRAAPPGRKPVATERISASTSGSGVGVRGSS